MAPIQIRWVLDAAMLLGYRLMSSIWVIIVCIHCDVGVHDIQGVEAICQPGVVIMALSNLAGLCDGAYPACAALHSLGLNKLSNEA